MFVKKILLALIFLLATLNADYVMTYKIGQDKMSFYFKNAKTSKMIITSNEGKVEIYHINNNSYIVSYYDGGINIVDVNKMKNSVKQMGVDLSSYTQNQKTPNFKIKKTRKKVWVGNIEGYEWIVTVREDGQKYKNRVVVSNDKRVIRVVRAMFKALSSMNEGMSSYDKYYELQKNYVTIKADDMELESFKKRSIPFREYKLPNATKTQRYMNNNSNMQRRNDYEQTTTVNYLADVKEDESSNEVDTDSEYISDDMSDSSNDDIDKAAQLLKSFF